MTSTDVAVPASTEISMDRDELRGLIEQLPAEFVEKYPVLAVEEAIEDMLGEALGPGGEINMANLAVVKVPSAELKSFMVPDENGDDSAQKTITGIPVSLLSRRSFWNSEEITNSPPDCRSSDLKHGVGAFGEGSEQNPTGLCANCPMAARGSAGKGTQASRCKESRVIFLLNSDLLPTMINIPSGSLPNFNAYGTFLFRKAIRGVQRPNGSRSTAWLRVEVELGLERDTNPAGQDYNKVTFKTVRRLDDAQVAVVNRYGMWVDTLAEQAADAVLAGQGNPDAAPADDVPFDAAGLPEDEVPVGAGAKGTADR